MFWQNVPITIGNTFFLICFALMNCIYPGWDIDVVGQTTALAWDCYVKSKVCKSQLNNFNFEYVFPLKYYQFDHRFKEKCTELRLYIYSISA